MEIDSISFDIESNPEMRFYVIYAGLRMFLDRKAAEDTESHPNAFSLAGAEAYCLLEDLKEQYPAECAECEAEYIECYHPELPKIK